MKRHIGWGLRGPWVGASVLSLWNRTHSYPSTLMCSPMNASSNECNIQSFSQFHYIELATWLNSVCSSPTAKKTALKHHPQITWLVFLAWTAPILSHLISINSDVTQGVFHKWHGYSYNLGNCKDFEYPCQEPRKKTRHFFYPTAPALSRAGEISMLIL